MDILKYYIDRQDLRYGTGFDSFKDVIVVIPVFDDDLIFETLTSIEEASVPDISVGVIVVCNHAADCSETIKRRNRNLAAGIRRFLSSAGNGRAFYAVEYIVVEAFDLPKKFSGVGAARKIGMDMGIAVFARFSHPDGLILSLDADTSVEKNYISSVRDFFGNGSWAGASVYFEHRLDSCSPEVRNAVVKYELYMRYYRHALKYSGHPGAYYGIGSAFAVRARDYAARGGMNRKQAGEDFYFVQKMVATGRYGNLNRTAVYPSSRLSDRTPFGTGKALKTIIADGGCFKVYSFEAFCELKKFHEDLPLAFQMNEKDLKEWMLRLHPSLRDYFLKENYLEVFSEVRGNSSTPENCIARFFNNFTAFKVIKYLNFSHEGYFVKSEIGENTSELLKSSGVASGNSVEEMLFLLRLRDKNEKF